MAVTRPSSGPPSEPSKDAGSRPPVASHSASRIPRRSAHEDLAPGSRAQLAAHDGNARRSGHQVDACALQELRHGAAGGHPDVAPGGPVDSEGADRPAGAPQRRRALAEQVVRGRVVRLAGVPEARRDGAERHRGAERETFGRAHQVEPAIALHVEDEIELGGLLVRERVAPLEPGGVEQHVDAAALGAHGVDRLGHGAGVREVHLLVARSAPCRRDLGQRGRGSVGALDAPELALHLRGSSPLAPRPQPLEEGALQSLAVAREGEHVGIVVGGRRRQVEQVEDAASSASREIRHDRSDDAARRSSDDVDALRTEGEALAGREGFLHEGDRGAPALAEADLDRARVVQGLREECVGEILRRPVGREIDGLDQCLRTLALQGLREAHDGAAERVEGALGVVAVLAAQARRGDEETTGRAELLV